MSEAAKDFGSDGRVGEVRKDGPDRWERLRRWAIRAFKVDDAEVNRLSDNAYLILCRNRNTRDSEGTWIDENGTRHDFDYVERDVVASGRTVSQLARSARQHRWLLWLEENVTDPMERWLRVFKRMPDFPRQYPPARQDSPSSSSTEINQGGGK